MAEMFPRIRFNFFEGYESPLSTLRFCNFEMDGKQFNSAEQSFQFHKAEFFENNELAIQIMAEDINPVQCRRLGDTIDTSSAGPNWPEYARCLMERICTAKFRQNEGFRKYLFKTRGSHLVYCDPEDRFWGNGLKKTNPKAKESANWLGPNHLGDILVRTRDTLMKLPDYKSQLDTIIAEEETNKRKYQAKLERMKRIRTTP